MPEFDTADLLRYRDSPVAGRGAAPFTAGAALVTNVATILPEGQYEIIPINGAIRVIGPCTAAEIAQAILTPAIVQAYRGANYVWRFYSDGEVLGYIGVIRYAGDALVSYTAGDPHSAAPATVYAVPPVLA